jgi:hypothetical protein
MRCAFARAVAGGLHVGPDRAAVRHPAASNDNAKTGNTHLLATHWTPWRFVPEGPLPKPAHVWSSASAMRTCSAGYRAEAVFERYAGGATELVVALGREGKEQLKFDAEKNPHTWPRERLVWAKTFCRPNS